MTTAAQSYPPEAVAFFAGLLNCPNQDAAAYPFTFQTFDDEKPGGVGRRDLAEIKQGPLKDLAPRLGRLNQAGAGIFVTVNGTDGRGRKKENITSLRAWWCDLDENDGTQSFDLAGLPLEPSMIVRTPGGRHLYWLAVEPMPCLEMGRRALHEVENKAIAQALESMGGDLKACDVARVLRVPGFLHRKAEPRPVTLEKVDGPRYSREQVRAAFLPSSEGTIPEGAGLFAASAQHERGQAIKGAQRPRTACSTTNEDLRKRIAAYLNQCPAAIAGDGGHHTLFRTALKLVDGFGVTEGDAASLLLIHYNPRCVPPWNESEIRHKVLDAMGSATNPGHLLREPKRNASRPSAGADSTPWPCDEDAPPGSPSLSHAPPSMDPEELEPQSEASGKASLATKALRLVSRAGAEAWMDEAGIPHLTAPVGDHVEHYRLKADPETPAGRWLARIFYKNGGKALPSSAKKDALENLISEATSEDKVFPTARRVCRMGERVFLDLCAPSWEVVEVTPKGWKILPPSAAPVRFTRAASMLPMPRPVKGGRVDDLRPFFNCGDDDFRLIVAWTLAALSGGREYPVLVFGGEPGSAKSTATRYARTLVDPNAAPLRKTPKEERDLFIAAKNAFALTFDNLSSPPDWLPDALCALALDTGYACRALYTDDEESVFRVAAPIILNGISEQLTRSDLADRALSVTLHRIPQEDMRPKDELDAAFNAALPAVLGAFLTTLSAALACLPRVRLDRYPRLAQTAKLMAAAEPALGWEPGTFIQLFNRAQESVAAKVAEGDSVAQALEMLAMRGGGRWDFQGSTTDLRTFLEQVRPQPMPPVWPPAVNKLGERLRRIAPQLRMMGWEVNPDGRDGTRKNGRVMHLSFPAAIPPSSSFSYFEEKKELSELSDCPKSNPAAHLRSDSSEHSTVRNRPQPSDRSSLFEGVNSPTVSDSSGVRTVEIPVRTVERPQPSEREPAPMLNLGQSDSSDSRLAGISFNSEEDRGFL